MNGAAIPTNSCSHDLFLVAAVPERDLYSRFFECGEIEFIWHYENATIATVTFERPESTLKALNIRELHNRIPIIVREYVESER